MLDHKRNTSVIAELIFPEHANHYGTLFGGNALSLMAKSAFVAATRYASGAVVLARSDAANFTTPIRVGELLELSSSVVRVGRSSMTVSVQGETVDMASGERRSVLAGQFEMVAVDEGGRPRTISHQSEKKEVPA